MAAKAETRAQALRLYARLLRSARTWPGSDEEKAYIRVPFFFFLLYKYTGAVSAACAVETQKSAAATSFPICFVLCEISSDSARGSSLAWCHVLISVDVVVCYFCDSFVGPGPVHAKG